MSSRSIAARSVAAGHASGTAGSIGLVLPLDQVAAERARARHDQTGHAVAPGRPSAPRRRDRGRVGRLVALVVLLVPLVIGSVGSYSTPPVTNGDELSDAQAQAKALAAKVAAQKAALKALAAQQAALSGRIDQTSSDLAGINADLADVKIKVRRMTADIGILETEYDDLVAQIGAMDDQIGRIAMAEMAAASRLVERKQVLADRMRAAYEAGGTSVLETVLSADSFVDAMSDVSGQLALGERDKALADQIAADQAALSALEETVTETRAATDDLRTEAAAEKVLLDGKLGDLKLARAQLKMLQVATANELALQKAAFAKLATNAAAAKALLAREAKAQAQLKAKIDRLIAAAYAQGNIPSVYNGSLIWPLAGIVTQEFGCTGFPAEPPLGNCAHFHIGIDIADPMYTPIHAAGSGRVVYVGPLSDGAWVVIIAHSKQLVTLYGHVDNRVHPPIVRAGDVVSQGQVIAYVGMTGNTTGPHLHWGVELNGVWVNPRLFV